ncbi:MAG: hypothetical protein A2W31_10785 [Planctomycetes bacterium RBG_16_64_10]|nr:MAG: hypothetical protein A2W31_10785 [Planctomycetes bacterium RBG_16_64_10]
MFPYERTAGYESTVSMCFLIAVALLVGLVWAAVFIRRGSLLIGCFAFLVVGYCMGHPFWSFHLGPVPLTLDRLLLAALAGGYLVRRRLGRVEPKPLAGADWLLFALVAWLSLSTAVYASAAATNSAGSPLWRLMASYWMPLVVYWLARQSRLTAH